MERCARIGLFQLHSSAEIQRDGLEPFIEEISKEYQKVVSPKLSRVKVILSIAIPLIPIIYVITSVVQAVPTRSIQMAS